MERTDALGRTSLPPRRTRSGSASTVETPFHHPVAVSEERRAPVEARPVGKAKRKDRLLFCSFYCALSAVSRLLGVGSGRSESSAPSEIIAATWSHSVSCIRRSLLAVTPRSELSERYVAAHVASLTPLCALTAPALTPALVVAPTLPTPPPLAPLAPP